MSNPNAIQLGPSAGEYYQSDNAIAVGANAGYINQ